MTTPTSNDIAPGTSREEWRQPWLTSTVRAFCDSCNHGWMADIEAAAMPIVGPMVINQPMDLDANAQQIVANWVALKVLVAAQASNLDEWIPEPHYRHVHNAQGAPANAMRVWVGHRWNLADHQPGRPHIFDFYFMPRSPDPSDAWDHSIKAVEAVLRPIVCPNHTRATLANVIGELRTGQWKLNVRGRARDNSIQPLIQNLELLWPDLNRHGSPTPELPATREEAAAVVQRAVVIVQWARDGQIIRKK
jgi:hypothetical protein